MLGDPIYNKTLRKEVGRGELDYEVYLRTRELLALQTPTSELVVPDELLFQIQHQTQELWMKCAAYEAANLVEHLDSEAIYPALEALDRVVHITRLLAEQIRVMPSRRRAETATGAALATAAGSSRRDTTSCSPRATPPMTR